MYKRQITSPVDALFETVSGFTTTGASILSDVEVLPKSILFWRSFTHWIGGMGVLVFILSLLPLTGGSHMNLMKAESPGPSVSRLVPKVRLTAKLLYSIYIFMTVVEILFLLAGKIDVYKRQSACTALPAGENTEASQSAKRTVPAVMTTPTLVQKYKLCLLYTSRCV